MFNKLLKKRVEKIEERLDYMAEYLGLLKNQGDELVNKVQELDKELHPKTRKSNVTCDSAANLEKSIKRKVANGWKLVAKKRIGKKHMATFVREI